MWRKKITNMKKLVKEALNPILTPKSPEDITAEIKMRLEGKPIKVIKETPEYVIYRIERSQDIQDIVKNLGGRDEEVFFNFYLILDNTMTGFKQILGVKVSPDGTINVVDAKGTKVETEYLDKFA